MSEETLRRFCLRVSSFVLMAFVGLSVWSGSPGAQCPAPDGLDGGPCCTIATPKVPWFPKFTQSAIEICWQNCNVSMTIPYKATWTPLTIAPTAGIPCGERFVRLDLRDAAGIIVWTGTLREQYSRTWLETDPGGAPLQVWRYLVNGDMRTLAAAVVPCPVPPCVPPIGKARFTGYVDYATRCGAAAAPYQHAWMITHACDVIDHAPGFPRAGAFHPDRAYTFVGPAAGFVPAPIVPIEGTPGSLFEAVRRRLLPLPGTTLPTMCDFEEPANHILTVLNQLCLCPGLLAPMQYMIGNLTIAGACGTTVTTPGGPFLPGFVSMGIGSWTIAGTYPGVERLRWNAGNYDYTDPCPPLTRREVFFGVTTLGGYPATQLLAGGPAGPLPLTFIDQSNSLRPASGATTMNVPYVSDHILNLNH